MVIKEWDDLFPLRFASKVAFLDSEGAEKVQFYKKTSWDIPCKSKVSDS